MRRTCSDSTSVVLTVRKRKTSHFPGIGNAKHKTCQDMGAVKIRAHLGTGSRARNSCGLVAVPRALA